MEKKIEIQIRFISETESELRKKLRSGQIVQENGMCFYSSGDLVYSCINEDEGIALLKRIRKGSDAFIGSEEDALLGLLQGNADRSLLSEFGIRDSIRRRVIVFRPVQGTNIQNMKELIPLEEDDRIVPLYNGDTAVIACMEHRGRDEITEFAAAVAETLESEAGITCYAGIGGDTESLSEIRNSFLDSLEALETGIRHHLAGRVFEYGRQTLERLVDSIPSEKAEMMTDSFFTPQTRKLFTEEILETIRVFFRNDLNLSTTSRQLFIHRNTLVYRMEKIKKETGLDLRTFEDAAVFRMLMSLAERTGTKLNELKEGTRL